MSERDSSGDADPAGFGGIFMSRGMRIQLPAGAISVTADEHGNLDMKLNAINVCMDPHVPWLEIALDHLEQAEQAHRDVMDAWGADDSARKGETLEAEFSSSIQAIAAAAVALDAFYAMVRRHVEIDPETIEAWRANRTARPRQIAEVFRRAFLIGPKSSAELRTRMVELFKWRDWCVHPAADFQSPVLRSELGVATEWRLAAFTADNARSALRTSLSIAIQLLERPRPSFPDLTSHCEGAIQFVQPLVARWERLYGELHQREQENLGPTVDGDETGAPA